MRFPWRRQPPELEMAQVDLAAGSFTDVCSWLKQLPTGEYALLLRTFDDTPPHAIAVQKAKGPGSVLVVRPKQ